MKLFVFHLLNDFSGSPKVLSQVVNGLDPHYNIELNTSSYQEGFLDLCTPKMRSNNGYRFYKNKLLRLYALFFSQIRVIITFVTKIKKNDVVYINTLLPFGAAIVAKIKGAKTIYHIHETSIKPKVLRHFLVKIASICGAEIIYVSHYVKDQIPLPTKQHHIVYNSLDDSFFKVAKKDLEIKNSLKTVLMICSLKAYKGVFEFIYLAERLGDLQFNLVCNANPAEIESFFANTEIPKNLTIYPKQRNVHPFYQEADLVLNLSKPKKWVETFGLTAIEAMAYGIPVIVPPIGGIAEITDEGITGHQVDSGNTKQLSKLIRSIANDPDHYQLMSKNCKIKALEYGGKKQIKSICQIIG